MGVKFLPFSFGPQSSSVHPHRNLPRARCRGRCPQAGSGGDSSAELPLPPALQTRPLVAAAWCHTGNAAAGWKPACPARWEAEPPALRHAVPWWAMLCHAMPCCAMTQSHRTSRPGAAAPGHPLPTPGPGASAQVVTPSLLWLDNGQREGHDPRARWPQPLPPPFVSDPDGAAPGSDKGGCGTGGEGVIKLVLIAPSQGLFTDNPRGGRSHGAALPAVQARGSRISRLHQPLTWAQHQGVFQPLLAHRGTRGGRTSFTATGVLL